MRVRSLTVCAGAALVFGVAGAPSSSAQPAARIAGTVSAHDGQRLDAASVTLSRDGEASAVVETARTDAGGRFSFDVPAGRYLVTASKPGYTGLELLPPTVARTEVRRLNLTAGGTAGGIDLRLRRAGSIAGRIFAPDGTPAAGAEVWAALRSPSGSLVPVGTPVVAAFDGRYEIAELPAGHLLVAARPAPGSFFGHDAASRAAVTAVSIFPGVSERDPGSPVRVFDGLPTEGIDVWLAPAAQRFQLFGRLYEREERRLREMAVEYRDLAGIRTGVWHVTDPDGYFVIEGVPPGTFLLLGRAIDPNGQPLAGGAATEVTLPPVEDVRLIVDVPGSIEGRVVPLDGALPAGNVQVSLVHTRFTVSLLYPKEVAAVSADGRFRLDRAYGTYRFEVGGLPDGWRVVRVLRSGREIPGGQITVGHRDAIGEVEIVVGPIGDR